MAEDSPMLRSLLVGLVTLVLVALIIGGVFSLFALGAVSVTGLASSGPSQKPSMYVPPLKKHSSGVSPTGAVPGAAPVGQSPTLSAAPSPSASASSHHKKHRAQQIQLSASPTHAAPSQRIVLSGSYPGGDGSSLQVQNRQGGRWTSFPVTVTVTGASFRTYIYSGNPGRHLFLVVDPGSGHASNPVAITIG